MDERGDGEHIGRNRLQFRLRLTANPDLPPAEAPPVGILAWMEDLVNQAINLGAFAVLVQFPEPQHQHDAENENNGNNVNNVNDNIGNMDNPHVDDIDDNIVNAEDPNAGGSAMVEAGIGVNQQAEEDDPLPGGSRKRSREEDEEDDEERSSKHFRFWDEFDCTSDSDTYSTDSDYSYSQDYTVYSPGTSAVYDEVIQSSEKDDPLPGGSKSPVRHACAGAQVAEEDPLPGPSRKRSRKCFEAEDERHSSPKLKRRFEFANSNSNTATTSTSPDPARSSCSTELIDASAVKMTEAEESRQVKEEDSRPAGSRKRPMEDDEEDKRSNKRFKR